ncbi:MAG: DUF411 domain-containing protein [Bermanella sp.]|tara:strand:- start:126 stop:632 length:507 start_codon:yes stop_codon:yes gene_type:complete
MIIFNIKTIASICIIFLITGCNDLTASLEKKTSNTQSTETMVVYKSPTCGCCKKWIDHLEDSGLSTTTEHPTNLPKLKEQLGISPQFRSCHTGVSKQGYVFEGHIPARYIHQFLSNPLDNALGLSVPGMPVGSPGMEVKNKFMPYHILVLTKDGSSEVFAIINDASQQ